MSQAQDKTLQQLLKTQMWEEALPKVEEMLEANPAAAQLHLLRGQLLQLQPESTASSLRDVEASLQQALALDATYFDALVELMHFYDAVCPDEDKAVEYAMQVKTRALQALDAANEVLQTREVRTS